MDNASAAPRLMSLHLLEEITNNFSKDRKLGAGAYGNVYKGVHKDGETIAVKVLHYIPGLDDDQFEKEYLNLASLQHKNIVRLVGYCHETKREVLPYEGKNVFAESTKKALCFEYMRNGSLDNCLSSMMHAGLLVLRGSKVKQSILNAYVSRMLLFFAADESSGLDWQTRYGIIKGICEGLKYLHEKLDSPMYHLDLKPANVLLDENMVPKIADFGLSRLFGGEQTQKTDSAIGTPGYIPPEYIDTAIISIKFDIYSLGVVIIKIMTGRDGYFRPDEMSSEQFIEHVHAKWRNRLQGTSMYSEQVKRCIKIALSCVQADRYKRPSIGVILNKLSETETMIQFPAAPRKDARTSMDEICHCISTDSELLDIRQNKLVNYSVYLTDSRGTTHEVTVTTVCDPSGNRSTFEPIQPNRIKIIRCTDGLGKVFTIDTHPTEPWILIGHYGGHASIWNHLTQARVMKLDITGKRSIHIWAAKFIAREQWLVAGDTDGCIHVLTYRTTDIYKLKKFRAHRQSLTSLAVHPRDPFMLSASADHLIKLWNWEADWECIRKFEAHSHMVEAVKFNPQIVSNTFASASQDSTVKIWSIFSPVPIATLDCSPDEVTAVDYFFPGGDGQYMVTGSWQGTVRIWDMRTNTCIRQIKGLQKLNSFAVVNCLLPDHPILITASRDGAVSFCDSNTHRYQNRIDFMLGSCCGFEYIEGTRSLVIAFENGIAVMDISPQRSSS